MRDSLRRSSSLRVVGAVLVTTFAAAALLAGPTSGGASAGVSFAPCKNVHPKARTQPGGQLWRVSRLRVSGMSCRTAAAAVRAGALLVPAGRFRTPGFRCSSLWPAEAATALLWRAQQRFKFTLD